MEAAPRFASFGPQSPRRARESSHRSEIPDERPPLLSTRKAMSDDLKSSHERRTR
jgi:hypothetical protein